MMPRAGWRPRHVPMTFAGGSVLSQSGSFGVVGPPQAASADTTRKHRALIGRDSIPTTRRQKRFSMDPVGVLQRAAMRTRLERSYRFESAHFLPKVPPGHKCARMHGHSYMIEIVIEGEVDPERGW